MKISKEDVASEREVAALRQFLSKQNHSWTRPREAVFKSLRSSPAALPDLVRRLKTKIDPVSVYRTVDIFEELGVVHRIWQGWKSIIELTDTFSSHHHHFVCENCGRLIDFDDSSLEQSIKLLSTKLKLRIDHHHLELFGLCNKCQETGVLTDAAPAAHQ